MAEDTLRKLVIWLCFYGNIVGFDKFQNITGIGFKDSGSYSRIATPPLLGNTSFQNDLLELEAYLNTDNVTEVFVQRNQFCDKLNNLLKLPQNNIRSEGPTATRAVKAIDRFSTKVGSYLRQTSTASTHVPRSEFVWAANLQQNQPLTIVTTSSFSNLHLDFQPEQDININILENVTGNAQFQCSASLPNGALVGPLNKVIHAIVFRKPTIFVDKDSSIIGSSVFSVAIDDFTPRNLSIPIKLVFKKTPGIAGKFSCVYFEFGESGSLGRWRSSGCRKTNETKELVFCECNHLTNFALLLDVTQSGINFFYLKVITWSGCSVSLVGLIITIALYSCGITVQNRLGSRIVVRLCISLTLLIIIFLAFSENRSKDSDDKGCMIASVSIHYFLLVTFMLMATEALSMYLLFVKPMQSFDQPLFLKRSTGASLAIPAAIVIITGVSKPDNLLNDKLCLVHGVSFYMGVLTPIIQILLFNSVVVVCSIVSLSQPSIASRKMSVLQQCKITITMSVLLGVTWLFALFAVGKATVPFQVIFTVLTSLQGFFVFVLFVLLKKETREVFHNAWTRYQYVKYCGCFGRCFGKGSKEFDRGSCYEHSTRQTATFNQSTSHVLLQAASMSMESSVELHRPLCGEASVEHDMTYPIGKNDFKRL